MWDSVGHSGCLSACSGAHRAYSTPRHSRLEIRNKTGIKLCLGTGWQHMAHSRNHVDPAQAGIKLFQQRSPGHDHHTQLWAKTKFTGWAKTTSTSPLTDGMSFVQRCHTSLANLSCYHFVGNDTQWEQPQPKQGLFLDLFITFTLEKYLFTWSSHLKNKVTISPIA